jgi:uncharacterized protein YjiS (DUF1127 family)
MNAYVSKEELALLPANRISYPEHYADASDQRAHRVGIVARVSAWLERRHAMSELANLTDRELSDIGLSRAELGSVFKPGYNLCRG